MKSIPPNCTTALRLTMVCAWSACAGPAGPTDGAATTTAVRIPFTLTAANNLSVEATLNGRDRVSLMFHTAIEGVSLTTAAIARLSQFPIQSTVAVTSWGGTAQARQSTGNTLQIGPLTWRDVALTESEHSGPGTEGKFGPDLFGNQVFEIDFDAQQLVIHPSLPPIGPDHERLDLVDRPGGMWVAGDLTVGSHQCRTTFLVHTGFGGTALLDEQFVAEQQLGPDLVPIRTRELKDSYGNIVRTTQVLLPSLRFGQTKFTAVPVGVFHGAIGSWRTSVLGGDLLKRCHLVFDRAQGHVYLAPSQRAGLPFGG